MDINSPQKDYNLPTKFKSIDLNGNQNDTNVYLSAKKLKKNQSSDQNILLGKTQSNDKSLTSSCFVPQSKLANIQEKIHKTPLKQRSTNALENLTHTNMNQSPFKNASITQVGEFYSQMDFHTIRESSSLSTHRKQEDTQRSIYSQATITSDTCDIEFSEKRNAQRDLNSRRTRQERKKSIFSNEASKKLIALSTSSSCITPMKNKSNLHEKYHEYDSNGIGAISTAASDLDKSNCNAYCPLQVKTDTSIEFLYANVSQNPSHITQKLPIQDENMVPSTQANNNQSKESFKAGWDLPKSIDQSRIKFHEVLSPMQCNSQKADFFAVSKPNKEISNDQEISIINFFSSQSNKPSIPSENKNFLEKSEEHDQPQKKLGLSNEISSVCNDPLNRMDPRNLNETTMRLSKFPEIITNSFDIMADKFISTVAATADPGIAEELDPLLQNHDKAIGSIDLEAKEGLNPMKDSILNKAKGSKEIISPRLMNDEYITSERLYSQLNIKDQYQSESRSSRRGRDLRKNSNQNKIFEAFKKMQALDSSLTHYDNAESFGKCTKEASPSNQEQKRYDSNPDLCLTSDDYISISKNKDEVTYEKPPQTLATTISSPSKSEEPLSNNRCQEYCESEREPKIPKKIFESMEKIIKPDSPLSETKSEATFRPYHQDNQLLNQELQIHFNSVQLESCDSASKLQYRSVGSAKDKHWPRSPPAKKNSINEGIGFGTPIVTKPDNCNMNNYSASKENSESLKWLKSSVDKIEFFNKSIDNTLQKRADLELSGSKKINDSNKKKNESYRGHTTTNFQSSISEKGLSELDEQLKSNSKETDRCKDSLLLQSKDKTQPKVKDNIQKSQTQSNGPKKSYIDDGDRKNKGSGQKKLTQKSSIKLQANNKGSKTCIIPACVGNGATLALSTNSGLKLSKSSSSPSRLKDSCSLTFEAKFPEECSFSTKEQDKELSSKLNDSIANTQSNIDNVLPMIHKTEMKENPELIKLQSCEQKSEQKKLSEYQKDECTQTENLGNIMPSSIDFNEFLKRDFEEFCKNIAQNQEFQRSIGFQLLFLYLNSKLQTISKSNCGA